MADHVAVMYLGKVVEFDRVGEVFALPYHPYTEALLSAVPVLDFEAQRERTVLVVACASISVAVYRHFHRP